MNVGKAATKAGKVRTVPDAVSYAEGVASAKDLARITRQPLSNVTHHVEELLAAGSIDIAYTEPVGNIIQTFYCVAELPIYSSEEFARLGDEEKQATLALVLQASMAEALASLWAGKLHADPRVMLAWNRVRLDAQGREDLAEEQDRSWERIQEIEAESANRRAETGEPGTTYVVTSFGYERSRTEAPAPLEPGETSSGG